jgi:hypothetical protein
LKGLGVFTNPHINSNPLESQNNPIQIPFDKFIFFSPFFLGKSTGMFSPRQDFTVQLQNLERDTECPFQGPEGEIWDCWEKVKLTFMGFHGVLFFFYV